MLTVRSQVDKTVRSIFIKETLMKGYRLTNKEFNKMILDEIDSALVLPSDYDKVLGSFMKNELVSTIPDECKGVVLEIGTSTKRETT